MTTNERRYRRIENGRGAALLERLPRGDIVGAEIGVQRGLLSSYLLSHHADLRLLMVDPWKQWNTDSRLATDGRDRNAVKPQSWHDGIRQQAVDNTRFAQHRRIIIPMTSIEACALVAPVCLDFVFVDAEHTYEACRQDIDAWLPKLKRGGMLCGHDIDNVNHSWAVNYDGVRRAVEETAQQLGVNFQTDEDYTWFMRLP